MDYDTIAVVEERDGALAQLCVPVFVFREGTLDRIFKIVLGQIAANASPMCLKILRGPVDGNIDRFAAQRVVAGWQQDLFQMFLEITSVQAG